MGTSNCLLFLFTALAVAGSFSKHHHAARAPLINLQGAEELIAVVREDENILSTVPDFAIVSETGPVCEYILISPTNDVIPFEIHVIDKFTGAAVLRVKDSSSLDCKHPEYSLQVQAIKCDDDKAKSESVPLKIRVKDTNNHAPEIENPWYSFHVEEGKVIDQVGVLKASDADCGHPNGEICEFKITNGVHELPFAINNKGVIRTTAPLNYTQTKSYILTIVAIDCAMRKSKSTLVTVHVDEKCVEGVTGVSESIKYNPGSGSKLVLPDVNVEFCQSEKTCEQASVETVISLKAGHVTQGCARDTVYDNQTIQTCGLSASTVKLINEHEVESSAENQIVAETGVEFDGSKAVAVSGDVYQGLIPDKFTISFSMKHSAGSKEEQANKQNILCESDDFNMNRHHFSVYVRHCKLEVVLRRESEAAAEFRAAEWRWAAPEVCDNEWHSYSLLFNGIDDVTLVVDGKLFRANERNPEILDDWPLHKTKQTKTKLVVGGCWHGRQQKMAQFFKGQLSSLYLLSGAVESQRAIQCAHTCPEQLQYTGVDELLDSQSATFSSDQTVLTLKAESTKHLGKMLRRVAYVNTQEKPAPGHRTIHVDTHVTCRNNEKKIKLPQAKGYVFVQQIAEPTVSISASTVLKATQHNVKIGQPMVPDFKITISQTNEDGEMIDVSNHHKIDYCKMHLKPARDMDVEYFSSPASLIAAMNIEFEHDKDGILLRGEESVRGYQEVLSKVHYFNTRPEAYNSRAYTVQCAIAKGNVLSNQLLVTMHIEGPQTTAAPPTTSNPDEPFVGTGEELGSLDSLELIERHFEPAFDQLGSSRLQNILEMDLPRPKALMSHHGYDMGQGAIAGGAVAVVVVVCVGFLLVLLVIGVLKMRDTPLPRRRRQKRQSDGGLHWDDSGMNITVNPLEDVEKNGGIHEEYSDEEDDEESSDGESECSYREEDEDEMSDEETTEVLPHCDVAQRNGLEWDDEENIATNARSYRV